MSFFKKTLKIILIPAILIGAGIFYFFVNPQGSSVTPKCVVRLITGWHCPPCGVQRAFHELLHGHLFKALSFNYFFVISVPYFLITAYAVTMIKAGKTKPLNVWLYNFCTHRYTLLTYVFLFFAWWILRNIIGC